MLTNSPRTNIGMRRIAGPRAGALFSLALLGCLAITGCHTDMWVQPKGKPLVESDFFPDDQTSRPLVPHTVARGFLKTDEEYNTGWTGGHLVMDPTTGQEDIVDGQIVDKIPTAALKAFDNDPKKMLERGHDRFDIYCSPCHSRLGDGNGMIAQRGFSQRRPPGNYHTDRLRKMPIGHFYQVITEGYGVMYSYAARVETQDRWAIAAYIRVLQKSQHADPAELRPDEITEASNNVKPSASTTPAGSENTPK